MVTIRDVARAAGVSIATVSRVFNDSSNVSAEATRRVRNVATRLDYWPHGGARSLTTSRTHAVGVLLPDLFGEFFSEVIRGIDHAARSAHFQILVSSSHADTEALVAAARSLRGRIDGLIAMVPDNGSAAGVRQLARRFPVVLLNPRLDIEFCSSVSIANFDGAHAVTDHLVRCGHHRIAIIKGPPGNVDAEERLRGYRTALRSSGRMLDPGLELQGDFTESSGYQCGLELLRLEPLPQAVFAANDYMAIGLLSALRGAGVRIPDDLAVAGFDDIAISRYLHPPLTTVHVDAYALGEGATTSLLSFMEAPKPSRTTRSVLPATLVVRGSCGSSAAADPDGRASRRRRPAPADLGAIPRRDGGTRAHLSAPASPSRHSPRRPPP